MKPGFMIPTKSGQISQNFDVSTRLERRNHMRFQGVSSKFKYKLIKKRKNQIKSYKYYDIHITYRDINFFKKVLYVFTETYIRKKRISANYLYYKLLVEISMISIGISPKPTGFRELVGKLNKFVFKFWFMKFIQNLPVFHRIS
jgi:hypothetical protein